MQIGFPNETVTTISESPTLRSLPAISLGRISTGYCILELECLSKWTWVPILQTFRLHTDSNLACFLCCATNTERFSDARFLGDGGNRGRATTRKSVRSGKCPRTVVFPTPNFHPIPCIVQYGWKVQCPFLLSTTRLTIASGIEQGAFRDGRSLPYLPCTPCQVG